MSKFPQSTPNRLVALSSWVLVLLCMAACTGQPKKQPESRPASQPAGQSTSRPAAALEDSTGGKETADPAKETQSMTESTDDGPGKIELSEEEWCQRLTPEQVRVLRRHGTERAFTGELWNNKKDGVYVCAACDLPLYDSETKFDSGTGWPSYYAPIDPDHIGTQDDRSVGMVRTEVHCARCGGHLGHIFPDGPPPTGMRHCINSVSLKFKERE